MTEPTRWRNGGPGVPSGMRELFSAGVPPHAMTAADRERAMRAARSLARGATGAAMRWTLLRAALAGGAVGGVVLAALIAWMPASPPASPRAPRSAARALARPAAAPAAIERAEIVASPRDEVGVPERPPSLPRVRGNVDRPAHRAAIDVVATEPVAATAAPVEDPLARETAILTRAYARLDGSPEGALADLDLHATQFPEGQLASNRECIAVLALDRLGRTEEAGARARAAVARFPRSPCAERLRRWLAPRPTDTTPE